MGAVLNCGGGVGFECVVCRASGIIALSRPKDMLEVTFHTNFNKRIVKEKIIWDYSLGYTSEG